jgi:predicted Na+-dependent transporter
MLYRRTNVSFGRCLATRTLIDGLLNVLLTPLWLNMLYGKGYWFYMSSRLVKNLVLLPLEALILYYILKAILKINQRRQAAHQK